MRGDRVLLEIRIIAKLLDGKSHPLTDFEQIRIDCDVIPKTIRRILKTIEDVAELSVITFNRDGRLFWRSDSKLAKQIDRFGNKKCSYCQERFTDLESNFHRYAASPDGYKTICKKCSKQYNQDWRGNNRAYWNKKQKKYYYAHRDHILKLRRERRENGTKSLRGGTDQ